MLKVKANIRTPPEPSDNRDMLMESIISFPNPGIEKYLFGYDGAAKKLPNVIPMTVRIGIHALPKHDA